jgi:hypothetical protein
MFQSETAPTGGPDCPERSASPVPIGENLGGSWGSMPVRLRRRGSFYSAVEVLGCAGSVTSTAMPGASAQTRSLTLTAELARSPHGLAGLAFVGNGHRQSVRESVLKWVFSDLPTMGRPQ